MSVNDLGAVSNRLQGLNADLRSSMSEIHEALSALDSARSQLLELNDPHARNALADVSAAASELREILTVWANDYERLSDELCRKIIS